MIKAAKIWLITAAILTVAGLLIFGGAMTFMGWNFSELSTDKFETNTYEFDIEIKNVDINCDTADIELLPSTDGKASVICYEHKSEKHAVTVSEGTLEIKLTAKRKWYEHIGINFKSPSITVYLPEGEYVDLAVSSDTGAVQVPKEFSFESIDVAVDTGAVTCYASSAGSVKIKASTGMISVGNLSCSSLDLRTSTGAVKAENIVSTGDVSIKVSTGRTELCNVECAGLSSKGNTGDLSLEKVMAKEKLSVERSTGDVTLEASDASEIYIKTNTGDVRGTLLSEKIFFASSDTGSVRVPKTTAGGKCEITTDTGNINIEIE